MAGGWNHEVFYFVQPLGLLVLGIMLLLFVDDEFVVMTQRLVSLLV